MYIQQVDKTQVVSEGADGKKHRHDRFEPRSDVETLTHEGRTYGSVGNGVFNVPDEVGLFLLGFPQFRQPVADDVREHLIVGPAPVRHHSGQPKSDSNPNASVTGGQEFDGEYVTFDPHEDDDEIEDEAEEDED